MSNLRPYLLPELCPSADSASPTAPSCRRRWAWLGRSSPRMGAGLPPSKKKKYIWKAINATHTSLLPFRQRAGNFFFSAATA